MREKNKARILLLKARLHSKLNESDNRLSRMSYKEWLDDFTQFFNTISKRKKVLPISNNT